MGFFIKHPSSLIQNAAVAWPKAVEYPRESDCQKARPGRASSTKVVLDFPGRECSCCGLGSLEPRIHDVPKARQSPAHGAASLLGGGRLLARFSHPIQHRLSAWLLDNLRHQEEHRVLLAPSSVLWNAPRRSNWRTSSSFRAISLALSLGTRSLRFLDC